MRRGVYSRNLAGTAVFLGLRLAEPLLQYAILRHDLGAPLLRVLGQATLPPGPPNTGVARLDALGLSPYRLALFGMAAAQAAKHVLWQAWLGAEDFPPSTAAIVAGFNCVVNTVDILLFTGASTSASLSGGAVFPQTPLLVGLGLFTVGIAIELGSEVQRWAFKKDAKNKGKACTTGLWALLRHPNYAGYTLEDGHGHRLRRMDLGRSYLWLLRLRLHDPRRASPGIVLPNQGRLSLNALVQTNTRQYGTQWDDYKKNTPYNLLPYVF